MGIKYELLIGRPGTGKTYTLINTMKQLGPGAVLVSHTRAAADEVRQRMHVEDITIKTVHALAYEIQAMKPDRVATRGHAKKFAEEMEFSWEEVDNALLMAPTQRLPGDNQIIEEYEAWCENAGMSTYNMMLGHIIKSPNSVKNFSCSWLVVDEAQDLSPDQWTFLGVLIDGGCIREGLLLAGDDYQAIFGWAGADPLALRNYYHETKAELRFLEQSYRVPESVHEIATMITEYIPETNRITDMEFYPTRTVGEVQMISALELADIDEDESTLVTYHRNKTHEDVERFIMDRILPYRIMGAGFKPGRVGGFYCAAAQARRALHDLQVHGRIPKPKLRADMTYAAHADVKHLILEQNWGEVVKLDIEDFDVPSTYRTYLLDVDIHAQCNIKIGTIHQAKGREADHVIYVCDEDTHPGWHPNAVQEFIRTTFVAVTRTRNRLTVVNANSLFS